MINSRLARVGTSADLDWITSSTVVGMTIDAAVPLVFEAYATVVVPGDAAKAARSDAALLAVLAANAGEERWWLGYLDTGASDVVRPDVPRATSYSDWGYVLLEGGPDEALSWRSGEPWFTALPELVFPADRHWLVSTLWDDDWRCVGGPAALIDAIVADPDLESCAVLPGQDATPPGHVAF